jgi:signal transduction histidine kinase
MRFRPRARFGLRARISLAFGLGALLLSVLLASVTWGLTRENLLNQRDNVAVDRVLTNAVAIRDQLDPQADVPTVLDGISRPEGATPLVRVRGEWVGLGPAGFGSNNVDPELLSMVESGAAARMRYDISGSTSLVVGVPIPSQEALYFEAVTLADTEETLNGLAIILVGAATVTTLAGFAIGFYASGRTLRPLTEVGEAAEAISGGRLDVRLESRADPDLRPLTDSFNHMVEALQERVERDARFASEVSHELRSPVMTLTASIEVLENNKSELPERAQTAVTLLSHDIERFQQLVEDLLEISRVDAGAVRLDLVEVFAAEFVRQAVTALGGADLRVVVDPAAEEAVIDVDKRRMAQVIANLLDNARKYADRAAEVEVDLVDDQLLIVVEDEGPGVPVQERGVIFDRFSRGSTGGRRGDDLGTGLGLALVKEHVNLHGGRVWVEDRADGRPGARFVVQLPAMSLEDVESPDADLSDASSEPSDADAPDAEHERATS